MYFLFNIVFLIFKFRSIHEKRVYSLKPAARCRTSFVCVFFLFHSSSILALPSEYTQRSEYISSHFRCRKIKGIVYVGPT